MKGCQLFRRAFESRYPLIILLRLLSKTKSYFSLTQTPVLGVAWHEEEKGGTPTELILQRASLLIRIWGVSNDERMYSSNIKKK